ncbi:MAG: EF-hand domain-containing protein [Verrucomicrobia bacterium]|nr:EF-hand domain-containing protein [Verrucomicrobiota bacterium]
MKTHHSTYRGTLALGLLAFTLSPFQPRLLAATQPDGEKINRLLKRFDLNQNGQLDPAEQVAAEKARQEAFQRLHGKYDTDGNGQLSETEKNARRADLQAKRQEILKKFDKDGDGRLNREEKAQAMAARKTGSKSNADKKEGA